MLPPELRWWSFGAVAAASVETLSTASTGLLLLLLGWAWLLVRVRCLWLQACQELDEGLNVH